MDGGDFPGGRLRPHDAVGPQQNFDKFKGFLDAARQRRGPWGIGNARLGLQIEYFSGEFLEVMVFDRELPGADVGSISAEKMKKWRIP